MKLKMLLATAFLGVLILGLQPSTFAEASRDAESAPSKESLSTEAPLDLSGSCSANVFCDDGSTKACSCPAPLGGSCNAYPNGSPWGGYVDCACNNGTHPVYYCSQPPPPACNRKACDLQCGGPGMGRCVGDNCVCL